jgi:signal transduction histidine kinase
VLLSVVLVVSVLALVAFIFWLRGRQRTRLAEAELKRQEGERNMMIEGQENERKRIARELHDGLVQELTAIAINLQSSTVVDKQQIIDKVTQAAREARNIAHQMMPVSLMQLGLINALQDLFQQTYAPLGIGYEFEHFTDTKDLSDAVSVSLYRICQELVANSVKHAGATLVHVLLRQTPQQIMLVFEDNGKGFDVTLNRTGIGMVSITSRVRYLNGEISFDSDDGAGTTAIVKIPLHNPPTTA